MCYFNGFTGIFWANVSMSAVFFRRALLYDEDVGGLVIGYVLSAVWLTANLIYIHLILTKVGMIYLDAEVLREGNDSTLNNLEEGVVILKEEDLQVQFQNQAAIKVERKINDKDIFDATGNQLKVFAKIDSDLFKLKTIVDSHTVIRKL